MQVLVVLQAVADVFQPDAGHGADRHRAGVVEAAVAVRPALFAFVVDGPRVPVGVGPRRDRRVGDPVLQVDPVEHAVVEEAAGLVLVGPSLRAGGAIRWLGIRAGSSHRDGGGRRPRTTTCPCPQPAALQPEPCCSTGLVGTQMSTAGRRNAVELDVPKDMSPAVVIVRRPG